MPAFKCFDIAVVVQSSQRPQPLDLVPDRGGFGEPQDQMASPDWPKQHHDAVITVGRLTTQANVTKLPRQLEALVDVTPGR